MDKLNDMFNIQYNDDNRFINKARFASDDEYRLETIEKRILLMVDQLIKLLNCFNWKPHKDNKTEDMFNIKEQIIDIQKFLISLSELIGIDDETYYDSFVVRSKVLHILWNNANLKFNDNDKVIIFDLDGVICDYDKAYLHYLTNMCGLKPALDNRKSYSYYEKFNISRIEEEQINDEFVLSGGFSRIDKYDYVDDVIKFVISKKIKPIFVSARPFWKYSRILLDTYSWFEFNIPFIKEPMIIFDKDKADAIINNIMPANIICMVEDRDKHAIEVSHIGIEVLLLDKEYNRQIINMHNIIRVKPENLLDELKDIIK